MVAVIPPMMAEPNVNYNSIDVFDQINFFHCLICKQCFKSEGHLHEHCRFDKLHEGAWCGRHAQLFRSPEDKITHVKIDEEHNICTVCAQDFIEPGELDEHITFHPTCRLCLRPFLDTRTLDAHFAESHAVCPNCKLPFFPSKEKRDAHLSQCAIVKCRICGQIQYSSEELEFHRVVVHTCNLCSTSGSDSELAKHVETQHPKCSTCGIHSKDQDDLTRHVKQKHLTEMVSEILAKAPGSAMDRKDGVTKSEKDKAKLEEDTTKIMNNLMKQEEGLQANGETSHLGPPLCKVASPSKAKLATHPVSEHTKYLKDPEKTPQHNAPALTLERPLCSDNSLSKEELTGHLIAEHVKCLNCEQVALSKVDIEAHKDVFHPKCDLCQDRFQSMNQYQDHERKGHICCNTCDTVCRSEDAWLVHDRREHYHPCELCEAFFRSTRSLNSHQMTAHVQCKLCETILVDDASFHKHQVSTHLGCSLCDQFFKSPVALSFHQKLDHRLCPFCTQICKDDEGLQRHQSASHQQCPQCNAVFKLDRELDAHIASQHTFNCKMCIAMFVQRKDLVAHVAAQHTFECRQCKAVFKVRTALEEHIRDQHCFVCRTCSKVFQQNEELVAHVQEEHTFPCRKCDSIFLTSANLTLHTKRTHRPACRFCNVTCDDEEDKSAVSLSPTSLVDSIVLIVRQHEMDNHIFPDDECYACYNTYARVSNMLCHIENGDCCGANQRSLKRCAFKYSNASAYFQKSNGHHPFICPTCGWSYSGLGPFVNHIQRKYCAETFDGPVGELLVFIQQTLN